LAGQFIRDENKEQSVFFYKDIRLGVIPIIILFGSKSEVEPRGFASFRYQIIPYL
jgi:hypothetical protein